MGSTLRLRASFYHFLPLHYNSRRYIATIRPSWQIRINTASISFFYSSFSGCPCPWLPMCCSTAALAVYRQRLPPDVWLPVPAMIGLWRDGCRRYSRNIRTGDECLWMAGCLRRSAAAAAPRVSATIAPRMSAYPSQPMAFLICSAPEFCSLRSSFLSFFGCCIPL